MNLMKISEYKKIEYKHKIPYIINLSKGKKKFLFLGSKHTFNPDNPQFQIFKSHFDAFNPEIILIEGSKCKYNFANKVEAIKKNAEMGYLGYLAIKQNILLEPLDSLFEYEIEKIIKKYPLKLVFAFYLLRSIPYGRDVVKLDINDFKKMDSFKHFDCTITNLNRIHKEIFNKSYDINNSKFYMSATSPTESISILNKIAVQVNIIRDKYMINLIKQKLKEFNKVLAIVGASHAVMQEPELKDYFKLKL